MQTHHKKGLCYNCDEKFTRGHRCVQQKLYLLDVDSSPKVKEYINAQDTRHDKVEP